MIPIALLQLLYLQLYLRRVIGCGPGASGVWLLIYVLALAAGSRAGAILNGSLAYAPAALTLLILGGVHYRLRARTDVLVAALLFIVSLTARSVDLALCSQWPLGTHFLWHLLNAAMLFRLLQAYQAATATVTAQPAR